MSPKEFISKLEEQARDLGFSEVSRRRDLELSLFFSSYTGMMLRISVDENDKPEFYFWFRTRSWEYQGDRTDIVDTISVTFAMFLRSLNIVSSHLFDVPHPAVPSLDEFEIYARYLIPTQMSPDFYKLDEDGIEAYLSLMLHSLIFEGQFWELFGGCPCDDCRERLGIIYDYKNELEEPLRSNIQNALGSSENYNQKDRQLPTWTYYRDFDKYISIIGSKAIVDYVRRVASTVRHERIDGLTGKLILSENMKNYFSSACANKGVEILTNLEGQNTESAFGFLPLDNKSIVFNHSHMVVFDELGGLPEFKNERDQLWERHTREFQTLFAPSKIIWRKKVNDAAFENLVKDLLEREPDVIWVRKVAHTNEPDGGRDLIVNWKVSKGSDDGLSEHESPYIEKKVIVQCKAYYKGVGKSDVTDIRDTIEHHNYEGYFLAVSSYTTRTLTDHLDNMRSRGQYWVDWWTRQEIDERLKTNPDLISKYPEIFEGSG